MSDLRRLDGKAIRAAPAQRRPEHLRGRVGVVLASRQKPLQRLLGLAREPLFERPHRPLSVLLLFLLLPLFPLFLLPLGLAGPILLAVLVGRVAGLVPLLLLLPPGRGLVGRLLLVLLLLRPSSLRRLLRVAARGRAPARGCGARWRGLRLMRLFASFTRARRRRAVLIVGCAALRLVSSDAATALQQALRQRC